ncbi:PilL N-terminal domain-containing protein [Pasteurella skyensis]|uniref:PFGI-1 class ICE element type IV pilus protein PilL2 n=1 Tax=Phocoenobacter skyensis TaxID=97481 RepID=UPI0027465FA1|nr:PilL N-terminal domain-containing protein [Pasteurella skyensis]MDP8189081.1 PilL N-terminal domain-containing protein [Pasteurella skyensis]
MKKIIFSIPFLFILTGCVHQQKNSTNINGDKLPFNSLLIDENSQQMPHNSDSNLRTVEEDIYTSSYNPNPEVVRYGRYTLISSTPEGGQKYLLEQIVNIKMKKKRNVYKNMSVQQGIWNTLKGTGYSLCNPTESDVSKLFQLPLPRVHYNFGPTKLRDALQMLAGEAYELTVNEATRQVCFTRRSSIPEMTKPSIYIKANIGDYEQEKACQNH